MSVAIHPGRLRYEMARRGWSAAQLARESKLSGATISAAIAGRPIAATSLVLIAQALSRVPPIDSIDSLLLGDREESRGLG
ncbi:MAG: helix-turn-helix domain-containing protein [Acidimicrobiales bacterium]